VKRKPTSRRPSPPKTASELARHLGVSRQLISKHAKTPGAPALSDVDGWSLLLATLARDAGGPADIRKKIAAERLRLVKAMADDRIRRNREADRELLPMREATSAAAIATNVFFSELDAMLRDLPALIEGRDANFIRVELEATIGVIKDRTRKAFERIHSEQKESE
jgi:hypothetical protein